MTEPSPNTIRAALRRLLQQLAALRADPYSALQLEHAEREAIAALAAEPVGDDGDVAIDRWIESRPDWPDEWPAVAQSQLTALIGEALEHWGRPAALAAEPVGEGAKPVGDGPAAWLYKGDPDFDGTTWRDNWRVTTDEQVARFKARPDEPIPLFRRPAASAAPEAGEVEDAVKWLLHHANDRGEQPDGPCTRAATLLQQLSAPVGVPAAVMRAARIELNPDGKNGSMILGFLDQLSAPAPAVVPVAVAERLPGEGDCDAEGRCWWFDGDWHLKQVRYRGAYDTHWLPAHAIPLPQAAEGQA